LSQSRVEIFSTETKVWLLQVCS